MIKCVARVTSKYLMFQILKNGLKFFALGKNVKFGSFEHIRGIFGLTRCLCKLNCFVLYFNRLQSQQCNVIYIFLQLVS